MHGFFIQTLNGVSLGAILFLLAAGLSLIYGMMRILNLTHGSYYLLGGYIGLSAARFTNSFSVAIVMAAVSVAALGIFMERLFLRRFHKQELAQALLTFGFIFIIADLALITWGGNPQTLPKPSAFSGSMQLGEFVYPIYRLFLIAIGICMAGILWWLQEGTRIGAMLRAAVDDEETARSLGINVSLLFTSAFAIGSALAAIGGVLAGPVVGIYPGADFEILLPAFVVVIIGGLGSLKGAMVGALIVGLIDNYGKAYFPELALFSVFVPMVLILAIKPTGLFGRV